MPEHARSSSTRSGARKVFRLIDALEDSDDVQNVFANFDVSDEVMAEASTPDGPDGAEPPARAVAALDACRRGRPSSVRRSARAAWRVR